MRYRRVTVDDRYRISAYLELNLSKTEISQKLGFHKSTITRELKRNKVHRRSYKPGRANYKAIHRYRSSRKSYSITSELADLIHIKISAGWTPLEISGRMKNEGHVRSISHQTIYRYINRNEILRSKLKFYKRRGGGRFLQRKLRNFPWKKPIKMRPAIINERRRYGDWERDTMLIANHKGVLVMVERKSRYLKIQELKNKTRKQVAYQTKELLSSTKKSFYSLTNDNGPEFFDGALHTVPVYYCDPGKPQQRGTVENSIGKIRKYIGRKTVLTNGNRDLVKTVENLLNFRPRQCLGFKTPHEVFYNTTVALVC